jgi:hypothetical protein
VAALASGLRLEISCESDKKKMNFIFNYDQKIFLTEKMNARVVAKPRNSVLKTFREPTATDSESPQRTDSLLISYASRVDRIRLCAQFLASASEA